jgi:CP family cyanate transporter-like MFS transporter
VTRAAGTEGRLLALLGIVLLSLGMRSATSAFSPVFGQIDADLHLGPVVLGTVGALPLVAFATSGFVAPRLARRFGLERALLGAIGLIVLGQVARAAAVDALTVVLATLVTMLGIGVGNVLMPPVTRRYFPDRVGVVSAVYVTLFGVGATAPGFLAVPLTDAIGWRPVLGLWAITVAAAIIPWLALARRPRVATGPIEIVVPEGDPRAPRAIVRSPLAWGLVLVLIGSATSGYNAAAWLPTILHDVVGLDRAAAGVQTGVLFAMSIPAALLVPLWAVRTAPAVATVAVAVVVGVVGWGGLLLAPAVDPLIWSILIGLTGVNFPLALTQIAARATTPRVAARLSGFVQGVGYVVTGVVVFSIGVLHAATGDWTVPLVVMAGCALLPLPAVFLLSRPRDVR